jgi:hypothetical protein
VGCGLDLDLVATKTLVGSDRLFQHLALLLQPPDGRYNSKPLSLLVVSSYLQLASPARRLFSLSFSPFSFCAPGAALAFGYAVRQACLNQAGRRTASHERASPLFSW